jgi:hypothetical protein
VSKAWLKSSRLLVNFDEVLCVMVIRFARTTNWSTRQWPDGPLPRLPFGEHRGSLPSRCAGFRPLTGMPTGVPVGASTGLPGPLGTGTFKLAVTWNCAHIANATMRPRIEAICRANGFEPPVICTPLELMEE